MYYVDFMRMRIGSSFCFFLLSKKEAGMRFGEFFIFANIPFERQLKKIVQNDKNKNLLRLVL